jgi:trk system potassium uptake protein TrkH
MGIVVLFIGVLPYLGVGGKQLFKSEASGPEPRALTPRIKDTAFILLKIYLTMTAVLTVALLMAGLGFYDALCHTFGTLATGGFSTRQASIAAFDSLAVELLIILFMLLASMNFGLYYAMSKGDWISPLRNTEWRVFIGVYAVATLVIAANVLGAQGHAAMGEIPATPEYSAGHALRAAAFQVASILTTTGFATEDFDTWPNLSRYLFVLLMIVGGCAGSTSGGLKIVRVVILCKLAYGRVEQAFRPKTMHPVRINGMVLDEKIQQGVVGFFLLYVGVFIAATAAMSAVGLPFTSAISSVAATLNGVGPGLEYVGAIRDFSLVPATGKMVLCLCMLMGRLELLSVLVLFVPGFWKHA